MNEQGLQALASLLTTESEATVAMMLEQMRTFTAAEIERLGALAPIDSPAQGQVDLILAERSGPRVQAALLEWLSTGADLEEGVLIVARSGYPRLEVDAVRRRLDALADRIRPQLHSDSGFSALGAMIGVIHGEDGFHGNVARYYEPENSYLNCVVDRRAGLPISLTVLYILLGKRLGLAISGVPLPGHFIASLATASSSIYFDPFHEGTVLSLRDVMNIVGHAGQVFHTDLLRAATPRLIVRRMLHNLLNGYRELDQPERAELVRAYLSVL
ncbi:MAG: transglutaminase family protein [Chloroflexota bacterium]